MAMNVEAEIDRIIHTVDTGFPLSISDQRTLAHYTRQSRQANERRQEYINKLSAELDKMRAPSGDSSGTSRR